MYAQLCLRLSEEAPNFDDPGKTGNSTFRRLLLKQCEEEFNNRSKASQAFDKKDGPLTQEEEEQRGSIKRKMLGNIRFIGELAKLDMLHETILHKCIKQLLDKKKRASVADTSEDMECLCYLMRTVGPRIDLPKAKPLIDQYFDRLTQIMSRPDLPARIRFMMQDVQELRQHKWIPRKHIRDVGPKTIYQIRQEVWQDFSGHPGSQIPANPQVPRNSPPHHPANWQGRPNYGGKGTHTGRGLNDVFISDNDGKGHMFDNDFNNGAIPDHQSSNFGLSRYQEDEYDRFTAKDPWANLSVSHNQQRVSPSGSPTSTRHQQYGSRRPPPRPSPLNSDGEISLRPARDSMAAKTLGMTTRAQNQAKLEALTKAKAPPIIEKPKVKKPQGPSKADLEKQMEDILMEYLSKKKESDAIKSVKNMKAEKYLKDLFQKVIFAGVERNDEERLLIAQLIQAMYKEGLITKETIMQGMRNVLEESLSDKDGQNSKDYLAGLSARTITQGLISFSEIGKMLESEKHLKTLLMVLKKLEHMNGQEWLTDAFNESKINLFNCLPEKDRCNETMVEILEEESLAFLFPLLRIQSELYKKIEDDPNSSNIYKWIVENIDSTLQSQPEFVNVLTTCALKYATHDSTLAKGTDTTQAPDKDLMEKEKYAMKKMKPLLDKFLHEKISLQVRALYSLQVFCHSNSFPKGLLLRMFMMLYDLEIVEEEAYVKWKEDVNQDYPGKGKALFQVNTWLTWLETADEEGSESEPE